MRLKREIGRILSHYGYHVIRPLDCTARLLSHNNVSCIVDVGANDGGFATAIRRRGYAGRIISFEPLNRPFELLKRKTMADESWHALQYALGDTKCEVTMNVSGNGGASSSILPMLDACTNAEPTSRYVGTETVSQERLDDVLPGLGVESGVRTFLKVDAQGYEGPVLDGAADLIAGGAIVGMQLELSLVPLYEGAMTYDEGMARAAALGMKLMRVDPVFDDPGSGRALQIDAVFLHT